MLNSFMNEYPYTDFHEMNLSWLVRKIFELNKNMVEFIKLNTLKYADPFDWDITKQYEKNTIVMDASTGIAYLSVQPVPVGVDIDNTDYWTPIFDLSALLADVKLSICANDETGNNVVSKHYNAGDWLWIDYTLYRCKIDIPIGTAPVIGVNIVATTVENETKISYSPANLSIALPINVDGTQPVVVPGDYHIYEPGRQAIVIKKVE